MFMVGSVFRHIKTGPLRGEVECTSVWVHLLYVNNFIWNFAPTVQEGMEKYGGGVSKILKQFFNIRKSSNYLLVYCSNLVHG